MKTQKKTNQTIRLNPGTIKVLRDISKHGLVELGDGSENCIRGFIEYLIRDFIFRNLNGNVLHTSQALNLTMAHDRLCDVWLKYRCALRGEDYESV